MPKSKRAPSSVSKSRPSQKVIARKISTATTAKWRPVPAAVQTSVMSFVEDAICCYENSGNEEIDETLEQIYTQCRRTLAKVTVPAMEVTDTKSLNAQLKFLLSEEARLKDCTDKLLAALDKETMLVDSLENEVERLKDFTDDDSRQLHPILQNLQEIS